MAKGPVVSHLIVTLDSDPDWHIVRASDPKAETECGRGEGLVATVIQPMLDVETYEPGLVVILSLATGAHVCADCCTVVLARTHLETDEDLWAEFDHYDHSHGC